MKNPIIDAALKAQHDSGSQVMLRDVPFGTIVLYPFGKSVLIGLVYDNAGSREFRSLYGSCDLTVVVSEASTYMCVPLNVTPVTL